MKFIRILIHIAIWGLMVLILVTSDLDWQGFSTKNNTLLVPFLYGTFFNALVFYLNALYLYPSFWKTNRRKYWIFIAVIIFCISIIEGGADLVYANYVGVFQAFLDSVELNNIAHPATQLVGLVGYSVWCLLVHCFFWLLSFSYLLPKENLKNSKLENEQLKSELKFLKAQIDPHTLFNGINGIYHLIDHDTEMAKNYLHDFANILRYQIYDCKEEHILLQKEIAFLERFFQLNQLRHKDAALITWQLHEYDGPLVIAPLIFLPLVENAFKFLSNHSDPNKNVLSARMVLEGNKLFFCIENSYDVGITASASGGIGTANVKNRLHLLYPTTHLLKFAREDNLFKVELTLKLYAKN